VWRRGLPTLLWSSSNRASRDERAQRLEAANASLKIMRQAQMGAVTLPRQLTERVEFTLEPAPELSQLREQWRDLERRANPSFFQTWDWLGCWVEEARLSPLVLIGRQMGRGVLMALLERSNQRRYMVIETNALLLHHLGDKDRDILCIAYNGFLMDAQLSSSAIGDAISFLFSRSGCGPTETTPRWLEEFHMKGVPREYEEHPEVPGLNRVVLSRHMSWKVDLEGIRSSGKGYLEHLSSNTRYQIRRSIKRYKERGQLRADRAATVEEALECLEALKDLNKAYWQKRGQTPAFAYPFFESFHKRLIRETLPRGTVELLRVTVGNRPIGYLYNFVHQGWVYAYHSAFVYEDDPKLKPGLVCHVLCIERHLKERAHSYDFMAGDSRYKANLGTPGVEMLDVTYQRPLLKLRAENILRTIKRDLRIRLQKFARQ